MVVLADKPVARTCHISVPHVSRKVTKATYFVTHNDFPHGFHHGLHHDISGQLGIGLSNAVHASSPGSNILLSVEAPSIFRILSVACYTRPMPRTTAIPETRLLRL